MQNIPPCPQCTLDNTYLDGDNYVCPDCTHEWPAGSSDDDGDEGAADDGSGVIRDSNGNPLADGDSVILIKDLKVKGSSTVLKKGTKVKSIKLTSGDHEVDCRMEAGSFMLKAAFLKKA